MERLTWKTVAGTVNFSMDNKIRKDNIARSAFYQLVAERLAAYEDTGLSPDEIPHWIPVSERLPDPKDMEHIQVLVIQKSTITSRPNIMSVARWNGADWICRGVELARVTHWAYLPQPPKEKK